MASLFPRLRGRIISRKDAKTQRGFEALRTLRSLREPELFHAEFAEDAEDAEKITLNLCVFASLREQSKALWAGASA